MNNLIKLMALIFLVSCSTTTADINLKKSIKKTITGPVVDLNGEFGMVVSNYELTNEAIIIHYNDQYGRDSTINSRMYSYKYIKDINYYPKDSLLVISTFE